MMKLPTHGHLQILLTLGASGAARWMFGLEIVVASGGAVKRPWVYAILDKLERRGLVESCPEPGELPVPGMIRRRMYRLTEHGAAFVHHCQTAMVHLSQAEDAVSTTTNKENAP